VQHDGAGAARRERPACPGPCDVSADPDLVSGLVLRADRTGVAQDRVRTVRSWPLMLLAFPAAAEVWSGWVGIAQKTGFGLVSPAAGHLVFAPPGHDDHAPDRHRGVRGLRTARLAGGRSLDQHPDPPVRQVVRDLLLRTRHGRPGRLPPAGPGRRGTGTVGHHHRRVLCRSWSWPWGPHWPTCCAATPRPGTPRTAGPPGRPASGPRAGPPKTSPGSSRTRTTGPGPRAGPAPRENERAPVPARLGGTA
jgi:hypothetical protein